MLALFASCHHLVTTPSPSFPNNHRHHLRALHNQSLQENTIPWVFDGRVYRFNTIEALLCALQVDTPEVFSATTGIFGQKGSGMFTYPSPVWNKFKTKKEQEDFASKRYSSGNASKKAFNVLKKRKTGQTVIGQTVTLRLNDQKLCEGALPINLVVKVFMRVALCNPEVFDALMDTGDRYISLFHACGALKNNEEVTTRKEWQVVEEVRGPPRVVPCVVVLALLQSFLWR